MRWTDVGWTVSAIRSGKIQCTLHTRVKVSDTLRFKNKRVNPALLSCLSCKWTCCTRLMKDNAHGQIISIGPYNQRKDILLIVLFASYHSFTEGAPQCRREWAAIPTDVVRRSDFARDIDDRGAYGSNGCPPNAFKISLHFIVVVSALFDVQEYVLLHGNVAKYQVLVKIWRAWHFTQCTQCIDHS